jgi:carbon monoxide dehydrogenase subunit G
MHLSGKQLLNADQSTIWNLLMNPETLARIIPGISKLEKMTEHSFKSIMDIKIGPVNGSFTGNLEMDNIVEYRSFTLKALQNSKIGNGNALIKLQISSPNNTQTELVFDGDVKLSGLLAGMGQRIVGGVANSLIKRFFFNMGKELDKQSAA